MPSVTIPLAGQPNQRGIYGYTAFAAGKDQIFESVFITADDNPITQDRKVFLEKRPGWAAQTIASGKYGFAINQGTYVTTAYGDYSGGACTIYVGGVSMGDLGSNDVASDISEAIIGGEVVILISCSSNGGGYFVPAAAIAGAVSTFSGNRTSGNAVLTGVTVTSQFYVGQALSGTGIATGARILSYDAGASTVTMTLAATSGAGTATTVTRSAMAKIIDADFLGTCGGFVEMDGYIFTVTSDQSKIQHSDLNSVINWSAASIISANTSTDILFRVEKVKNQIVAIGGTSFEFFYNAGNAAGSVLSRTSQAAEKIGISSRTSAVSLQDQVYFMASGIGPQSGVWVLDGFNFKKISTPSVDKLIHTNPVYMSAFLFGGQRLVHIACGSATEYFQSLLYNADTGIWTNSGSPFLFRISGGGNVDSCKAIAFNSTSGKMYRWEPDSAVYQDDGSPYTMKVQTSKIDLGTECLKTIDKVSLIGSDIQSSGVATLQYSDDDYATWVTAGTFDLTKINPVIHRCAAYRGGRSWRLTHSANTPFRAQALKFDYKVGAH